jgi:SSS family solute:Na+ symporter
MKTHFTALDLFVLVAYLVSVTSLGLYIGRRQRSTNDYFIAERSIPWWAVMFSVVASETSALTFISIPGVAYLGNLSFLQVVAGYILGRVVVAYVLLPRYYQGELVTAYALLEKRFGLATRRFTSIVFMVTRGMADSVRVFATAIPVALILGGTLPARFVMPAAIVLLGILTILYTYKGGMKAVVWTELLQASVYVLGGLSAIILLGRSVPGGWGSILDVATAGNKLRVIDTYMGFDRPYTLFAGLLGGAFLSMASHGADQLIVQRLLTSRTLKDGQRAIIGSGFVVFAQFTLFLMVGIGLFAFYHGRTFTASDSIFPTFILEQMPPGLVGLIVAAILAATMSTHSGAINSLAAATTHDIYIPLFKKTPEDSATLRFGKLSALAWGIVLTGGALLFKQQGTPVVVIALSIASFTYGALLGGFFLGWLWRRAIQRDAILAMSVALIVMSVVVFAKQLIPVFPSMSGSLTTLSRIAFPWYVLIGTSVTLIVGILSSLTHPQLTEAEEAGRTWR